MVDLIEATKTKTKTFALAEGTADERQVPWKEEHDLHQAADQIMPRLATMHAAATRATGGHPLDVQQGLIVEAWFLLWCYASHDIAALRTRCAALEERVATLEGQRQVIAKTILDARETCPHPDQCRVDDIDGNWRCMRCGYRSGQL